MATSRVLRVTVTSKPCHIGASFKWLRLPRKNGRNVVPNEDLVIVCVVLLPAWPPCTPTRTMCPPLLFFLHLLWMVSTSMTKNLRYTYSSTWRSCRTQDVTFQISSTPFLINPTSEAFLTLPTSCQTQVKLDLLHNRGFRVVEIWECPWEKLIREREDVCAFVLSPSKSSGCVLRRSYECLYHKVDETRGGKIGYFDFMSLYPWVNKNGKYPLGHPEIISQPGHTDLSRYFSLVKCTVLPPNGLFHPVLLYHHTGKLTFPLCASCMTE